MSTFKTLDSIASLSMTIASYDKFDNDDINLIIDKIIKLLDLEDFMIYLADPINKRLKQFTGSENKRLKNGAIKDELIIPYNQGIVGSAAKHNQIENISNTTTDRRYIVDDKIRFSELAIPVKKQGSVIAVLDSEHSSKNYFSDSLEKAFILLGQLLIPALDQFRRIERKGPGLYFSEFTRLLKEEKLYKDQALTLTHISRILNIHPTYLSRIINEESSTNFSSILNKFRVEEVKKMLLCDQFTNYSTLGIAFEAGFSSKATFNRVFKKETSLSPIEFIKNNKQASKI